MKRPTVGDDVFCSTPRSADSITAFGGLRQGATLISEDERRALAVVYEFKRDEIPVLQRGSDINLMRAAQADGLRVMAWLAKYLEPGTDPLKALIDLAYSAGWDVDPQDVDWAQGAEEGEEE